MRGEITEAFERVEKMIRDRDAEIERLRAALKPFAEAAKRFTPYPKKMEGAPVELSITLAELRQAASAYEQSQERKP